MPAPTQRTHSISVRLPLVLHLRLLKGQIKEKTSKSHIVQKALERYFDNFWIEINEKRK